VRELIGSINELERLHTWEAPEEYWMPESVTREYVSVPSTLYEHRIFDPENSSSIQLLIRYRVNSLQAKIGYQERIVVNPHNTPTIDFYWNEKSAIAS